jgi:hypothetical protein
MTQIQIEEFASRIARLEKARRRSGLILVCGAGVLLMVVAVVERARDTSSKAVEAKEFVVVDHNGRALIRIGPDGEGRNRAVMEFLDNDGRRRILFGVDHTGDPRISVIDPEGGNMVVLETQRKLGAALAFRNHEHKSGILLGSGPPGVFALGFMAEDGRAHVQMGLKPDGSGEVTVLDRAGNSVFRTPR